MVVPETGNVNDLPATMIGPDPSSQMLLMRAIKPEQLPVSQTSSFASSQGLRLPLHSVDRQLTATPNRSADEAALKCERSLSAALNQAHLPPHLPSPQDHKSFPSAPQGSAPAGSSIAHTSTESTSKQENNEGPAEEPSRNISHEHKPTCLPPHRMTTK